ncbi:MAG: glycosyltransferase [Terriglobales bacterium]|jgi:glycosyltransferase involved in cell wall biosynthesis
MRDGHLHVLTLTPFYPIECDDAQGCFIAEPLRYLESLDVKQTILAVQPFYRGDLTPNKLSPAARAIKYLSLPGGMGLSTSGLFLFSRILHEVRRIHANERVDLVHAHGALPCGHAAALLSSELHIPFVVTVHGLDAYSTRQVKGFSGEWCKRISRLVYRSACRTICVSQKVAEQVMEGANAPVRTAVVYNGVDTILFSPGGVNSEPMQILSVGGLIPIKGHEVLLRAFASAADRVPQATCEIIGDGLERERLQELAHSLVIGPKVHFRGRLSRSEVAEAMRHCTVFALPSQYEALGCVYLEAMASGKPVVACRGQGIEEIIRNGENGFLVEPNEVSSFTEVLVLLLTNADLRNRIAKAAQETVRSGFTIAQQALSLRQVYEACAQ